MRRGLRTLSTVVAVACLAGCDWTAVGFDSSGTNTNPESFITSANAKNLTLRWSVPVTQGLDPVEAHGTVILPSGPQDALTALSATTGQTVWASAAVTGDVSIAGNMVYGSLPQPEPFTPFLRALDVSTGTVSWSTPLLSGNPTGPSVVDGNVVLQEVTQRPGPGVLVQAFDSRTGASLWNQAFGSMATPSAANGLVYVNGIPNLSATAELFAFSEKTGALEWHVPTAHCGLTRPAVANGKAYVAGETFDASTGAHLWDWPVCLARSTRGEIAVDSASVYVPYSDSSGSVHLAAFRADTGAPQWTILWELSTPPAVANNILFQGTIEGGIAAYDGSTGASIWKSPTVQGVYNAPIVANGVVYAVSTGGHLDAFHLQSG